jgi:hypothetical protein
MGSDRGRAHASFADGSPSPYSERTGYDGQDRCGDDRGDLSLAHGWRRRPRLLLTLWGKFQACLLEDLSRSRVNHSAVTLLVGIFLRTYLQACECCAA